MKFSIIMPVYNVEKYVKKCIESIFEQTYKNYELIIVNDGSTDSSSKIIKKTIKNHKDVKYVEKKNGGLSDARNFGLKYATGDYIWFIDSDDYIRKDALEILNNNSGADIISFGFYKVINGKINEVKIKNEDLEPVKRYLLNVPSACMKVYKRSLFTNNNIMFEKGKYYEDLGLTPTLINYTKSFSFINECLYYYFIRKGSIINNDTFNEKKDDKFWAINNVLNNVPNEYYDELEYICIKNLIIMYSIDILKHSKSIYKSRVKKLNDFFIEHFPNYDKNKYLKKDSIFTRIFVKLFKMKMILLCKLIIKIAKY